jgi:hypothetical protein
MNLLEAVEAGTRRYNETEAARERSREAVTASVLAALRGGERPTDVAEKSPFTGTYVRKLARDNGIPESPVRRPKARAGAGASRLLEAVEAGTRRYNETGAAHEESREAVTASVLAALRGGERPTDTAAKSPFTEAYVRKLAREAGIPEYLLRRYPKARAELEARLPRWSEAAKAIGGLGIGLDDAEYVGGVLWYGLTHHGSEGSPEEQKRVITDRLVRWATRDGGNAAQAADAVRSVLDEFLPGR